MSPDPISLRLWPGVVIAGVQLVAMIVVPLLVPGEPIALLAGVGGALLTLLWWLFASRAPWLERIGAVVLMALFARVLKLAVDDSIAGAGQGFMIYIMAPPLMTLALVAWAVVTERLRIRARRVALVASIALACIPFLLIRTSGIRNGGPELFLRWTPTPEQRLLAQANDEPTAPPAPVEAPREVPAPKVEEKIVATPVAPAPPVEAPPVAPVEAEWPGFRGPERNGIVRGVEINTDWSASPPVEMWRRPIGPGWSSFAVRGDLLYTQEQRGEEEIVACYHVSTGAPVWRHRDPVRFWESNGGPGPRGTPTIHLDRVYAFGATGILNALDAATGKVAWSRNVSTDTGRRVPDWGFASSPLVIGDVVIVAAAGTLAGYDRVTGEPRWKGPSYGGSYSSPHRVTIGGVEQVVLLGGPGAISVDPATGTVMWQHEWSPSTIVQPAVTDDGDILVNAITATGGIGTRRLHVTRGAESWNVDERWTSNGLKPYFNDFVVHKGHAFGFDGNILSSINLEDGKRNWKGGRYGNGQLVLLPGQDLLLVLSEDGELALVSATTDGYKEVAKFPVLNAKTWNHPVIVRNVLLVRNGEEMAAFRLSLAEPTSHAPDHGR